MEKIHRYENWNINFDIKNLLPTTAIIHCCGGLRVSRKS